jgi:methionine sulfoxide reductase heme-binding subunit
MAAARFLASRPMLWALLAVPALPMLVAAAAPGADFEELLHPSGEWSARLLVVALALTPLSLLLPRSGVVRWLLARRRAIGVAAFGYAALHTVFYVIAMGNLDDMLAELGATGIWTGWFAFLVMVPLALTSNDAAMRALRVSWKRLQRLAHAAAALTLVHWVTVHDGFGAALVHFAPLALLQLYRIVHPKLRGTA